MFKKDFYIDLAKYYEIGLIENGNSSKIYLFEDKNTKKARAAKILDFDLETVSQNSPINLHYDINTIFNAKYPSIIKYIGFSQKEFGNVKNSVIITKYMPKKSLINVIKSSKSDILINEWNDTKKLINIFGIASAISYLHKKNVILGYLTPNKILENKLFYPKVFTFLLNKFNIKPNVYLSPEILKNEEITTSSDVYSFAMIVYLIMTDCEPFEEEIQQISNEDIINEIKQGKRPKFNKKIPKVYQQLIENCWSPDPKSRPTFNKIVNDLKTDPDFITNTINKNEYERYVSLIDNKNLDLLAEEIGLNKINANRLNHQNFEIRKEIGHGGFGRVYKINEKENRTKKYAAKLITSNNLNDFKHELEIHSKLKHPAITELIGYYFYIDNEIIKPVIVSEYMKNGSLEKVLEIEREYSSFPIWNDTQRLICILGIASGIAYLHSKKILYLDIKPDNTLLDKYLFPKLIDFGLSLDEHKKITDYRGTAPFIAPEIFEKSEYSEASDVYAFGILVYEIMNKIVPFQGMGEGPIMFLVAIQNKRPRFNKPIPFFYKKLIKSCWKRNPKKRPTFRQIIRDLKKKPEFITVNVNKDVYLSYISYIEGQNHKKFGNFTEYSVKSQLENIFPFRKMQFQQELCQSQQQLASISNGFQNMYQIGSINRNSYAHSPTYNDDTKSYSINDNFLFDYLSSNIIQKNIHINEFTKVKKINDGKYAKIYQIIDSKTSKCFSAKAYKEKYNGKSNPFINAYHLNKEIEIISSLKHQSIIKYVGYSERDFEDHFNKVIITEYLMNGSLEKILEMERSNIKIPYWNDTMKLITIYGIASAMSYLHENHIIYRDLKAKNIHMDDNFFPKIVDFGKSIKYYNDSSEIKNLLQNSIFSAPEIIFKNKYTKSSDVYSFAMLVYEIMAKEYPFGEVDHFKMMYDVLFLQKRPVIPSTVPEAYKNLIITCWNHDPQKRLTFNQILYELENNKEFITKNVNQKFYFAYIQYLKGQSSEINKFLAGNFPNQQGQTKETTLCIPSKLANINVSLEKFGIFAGPLPLSKNKNNNSENTGTKIHSLGHSCPKQINIAKHLEIKMTLFIESPYQDKQTQTQQQQQQHFLPYTNHPNALDSINYYPMFWPYQYPQLMVEQPYFNNINHCVPIQPPFFFESPYFGYFQGSSVGIPFHKE